MAALALFSPSVLSSAASGYRLPTLQVTLAFVDACAGDRTKWERRWLAIAGQTGEGPPRRPPAVRIRRVAEPAVEPRPAVEPAAGWVSLPQPAQLPLGPQEFIGRKAELAHGRELVAASEGPRAPVLISGQIGVGKTAFALELANDIADSFPDGQLYADLGAGEPEGAAPLDVMDGFLRSLGVPAEHIPADPTQRTGLYRSLLVERRVLVLLDDAYDEAQVRPLCAPAPGSQILVTSRAQLLGLDGARRMELDVLAPEESMAMLVALAGERRTLAEPEASHRLALLCCDLPLALSIVGRELAARPEWTIAYTASRLAEDGCLLERMRVGDVSLRGRLSSGYQRLSVAARQALHQVALDPDLWTTADRLAVPLEIPVVSAEDQLEALVQAGLLRRMAVAGRYSVPPLVRLFIIAEQQRRLIVRADQSSRSTQCSGWLKAGRRVKPQAVRRTGRRG